MPMCNNRVAEIILVWSPDTLASAHRYCVMWSGASLSVHNVIVIISFIDMRSLGPDNIFHGTIPYVLRFPDQLQCFQIKFLYPDIPVSVVLYSVWIWMCSDIVTSAIIIKEQAGIDALCTLYVDRLRPWSFRSCRCHDKVSSM